MEIYLVPCQRRVSTLPYDRGSRGKMQFNSETKYTSLVNEFKAKLARILQDREEGFVRDGQLCQVPLERIVATLKRGR